MVVMYLLRADTSPRWKIRCIQHVATRQSMQEGVLPDARAQVSPRPGRPAASVRDTPGVRTTRWSPPAPQPLGLWLLLLLPCCQPERLLCARPAAARHCIPGASPAAGVLHTFRTPRMATPIFSPGHFSHAPHTLTMVCCHRMRGETPNAFRSVAWGSFYRPSKRTRSNICPL